MKEYILVGVRAKEIGWDSGLGGARKGVLGATLVRVETIVKVD